MTPKSGLRAVGRIARAGGGALADVVLAVPRALGDLRAISTSMTALDDVVEQLEGVNARLRSVDAEVGAMRRGVDDLGDGVGGIARTTAPLGAQLGGVQREVAALGTDVAALREDVAGVRVPLEGIHGTVTHLRPAAERLERLGSRWGARSPGRLPPAA